VYIELDVPLEQAVDGLDENLADIDIELFGHDVAYLVQDAHGVDALDVEVDRKFQSLARFPFHGQNAAAESGFQLVGQRTLALVDDHTVLVVDEAQGVVARDGLAAVGDDEVLLKRFGGEFQHLLAVYLLLRGLFLRLLFLFLGLFASDEGERDEFLPSARCGLFFFQLVAVGFAQDDGLESDGGKEFFRGFGFMQFAQLLDVCVVPFHFFVLEEFHQLVFAHLLHGPLFAFQDAGYLGLGLGGGGEVYPRRLHALRLGGEDFHLVAALQLVAQRNELVVHLGADAVAA